MYGERIKQIRSKLDISVAKMAAKIDIPERTIAGYEREERLPSIEFAARLSTILNVNGDWFLTGKGEMFKAAEFAQAQRKLAYEVAKILKEEGLIK